MKEQDVMIKEVVVGDHRWRVIEEPRELPYLRMSAYFMALFDIGRKAATADLLVFVDKVKEAINDKAGAKIDKIGFYVNVLEANLTLHSSYVTLFEAGSCFILMEGEPLDNLSRKFHTAKWDVFRSDEAVRAFFLSSTLASLRNLDKQLDTTQTEAYLSTPEVVKTIETFLKSLGTDTVRTSPTELLARFLS